MPARVPLTNMRRVRRAPRARHTGLVAAPMTDPGRRGKQAPIAAWLRLPGAGRCREVPAMCTRRPQRDMQPDSRASATWPGFWTTAGRREAVPVLPSTAVNLSRRTLSKWRLRSGRTFQIRSPGMASGGATLSGASVGTWSAAGSSALHVIVRQVRGFTAASGCGNMYAKLKASSRHSNNECSERKAGRRNDVRHAAVHSPARSAIRSRPRAGRGDRSIAGFRPGSVPRRYGRACDQERQGSVLLHLAAMRVCRG